MNGTQERPRVYVGKSNRYVYVQVVDDNSGTVLASASTLEKDFRQNNKNMKNQEACKSLGKIVAGRLKKKKIKSVLFDRGTSRYHGRIKALADAMREEGLDF
jgi:large subunit ribosomal protein L18